MRELSAQNGYKFHESTESVVQVLFISDSSPSNLRVQITWLGADFPLFSHACTVQYTYSSPHEDPFLSLAPSSPQEAKASLLFEGYCVNEGTNKRPRPPPFLPKEVAPPPVALSISSNPPWEREREGRVTFLALQTAATLMHLPPSKQWLGFSCGDGGTFF